jgi:hypothetical protein
MRLLERDDTGEIRLTDDMPNDEVPPYAILSHIWGNEEVTFEDLMSDAVKNNADGTVKKKSGYAKIKFCGD